MKAAYQRSGCLTHYYKVLWDVLTAVAFGEESLIQKEVVRSKVHTNGVSQGQTYPDETGRPVNLVHDVDREAFFEYITDLARQG